MQVQHEQCTFLESNGMRMGTKSSENIFKLCDAYLLLRLANKVMKTMTLTDNNSKRFIILLQALVSNSSNLHGHVLA